jgi:hypothetical protein
MASGYHSGNDHEGPGRRPVSPSCLMDRTSVLLPGSKSERKTKLEVARRTVLMRLPGLPSRSLGGRRGAPLDRLRQLCAGLPPCLNVAGRRVGGWQ